MSSQRPVRLLWLFLAFQVLYASFARSVFPLVGDAPDYASLIGHGVFHLRPTHVGFYVLYFPFDLLNRGLLGVPPDLFLNLVTTFFGALTVPVVYLVVEQVTDTTRPGMRLLPLYAAVLYGLTGVVWYHALFAEVQALMLLLMYGALLLFLQGRYPLSGVALAVGALVSQAIAPSVGWMLATAITRRVPIRQIAIAAGCFAVVVVLAVLPVYEEYLFGTRGTLRVSAWHAQHGLVKTIALLGYSVLESYWLLVPLLLLALPEAPKHRELLVMTGVSLPAFLSVGMELGHSDYGIVWLPLMSLVATYAAMGLAWGLERVAPPLRWPIAGVVAAAFLVTTALTFVHPKQRAWTADTPCLGDIHERVAAGHPIMRPYVGMAYGHNVWPERADVWSAPWHFIPETRADLDAIDPATAIYVIDYLPPSHFLRAALLANPLARRLLSEETRLGYLEEFAPLSAEARALAPDRPLTTALTCGGFTVWRMAPPAGGGGAP